MGIHCPIWQDVDLEKGTLTVHQTLQRVDKKLQFVLAVQALSRLNRSATKLGKRTEDLFILDFFNSVDDIKTAFDPFYTVTTLSEATDVNVLHELKDALD